MYMVGDKSNIAKITKPKNILLAKIVKVWVNSNSTYKISFYVNNL